MNWCQFVLWPEQRRLSSLKYPSYCMAVRGRAGMVITVWRFVKGRTASNCCDVFNAEHWPETTRSSHRWRGLILIIHHVNKQSQIILLQEHHCGSCGYQICSAYGFYWRLGNVGSTNQQLRDVFFKHLECNCASLCTGRLQKFTFPNLIAHLVLLVFTTTTAQLQCSLLSKSWHFHPSSSVRLPQKTLDINPSIQVLITEKKTSL